MSKLKLVEQKLLALEARVAALEAKDRVALARAPTPPTLSQGSGAARTTAQFEVKIGLAWLNRAGAAAVVAALAFATSWAHTRGYLTPLARTLLLAAGSASAFAYGLLLAGATARSTRVFSYGVVVVGTIGLYLALFSASIVDGVLSPAAAMSLACVLTAAIGALAHYRRHALLGNLAAIGGLAIPVLASTGQGAFAVLFVLLTLQSVGFLWISRRNDWSSVATIQAIGVSGYYLAFANGQPLALGQAFAVLCGLSAFIALYLRDQLACLKQGLLEHIGGWCSLIAILVVWRLSTVSPGLAATVLGLACLPLVALLVVHIGKRERGFDASLLTAMLAVAIVGAAQLSRELNIAVLGGYLATAVVFVARLFATRSKAWRSLTGLCVLAFAIVTYHATGGGALGGAPHAVPLTLSALTLLPLWIRDAVRLRELTGFSLLGFASSSALGLCALVAWLEVAGVAVGRDGWQVYIVAPSIHALFLLAAGFRLGRQLRLIGLGILGLVAAKIVLHDLWHLPAGPRVGVLLIVGLVLMAASYLYSRRLRGR